MIVAGRKDVVHVVYLRYMPMKPCNDDDDDVVYRMASVCCKHEHEEDGGLGLAGGLASPVGTKAGLRMLQGNSVRPDV